MLAVATIGVVAYLLTSLVQAADAPTITTVTPSSGPPTGGQQVTITGTDFASYGAPEDHAWVNTGQTLPGEAGYSHSAVIDDKIYLFGGYQSTNNRAIYSADVSDPTNWTDTGQQLPGPAGAGQLVTIGSSMYLYGGVSSNAIYTADVSDPTNWTDTGSTLPLNLHGSQAAIIDDKIYLFGGASTNNIYSADISDPTTFVDTGSNMPVTNYGAELYMDDTNLYFLGGSSGSRTSIYTASRSNPTTWTNTGKVLPAASLYGELYEVGGELYLTSGINNRIYTASPSDPTTWTDTGKTLPDGAEGREIVVIGTTAYLFGGLSSNAIYSANIAALEAYFGEARASIVSVDKENDSMSVITPAHEPGVVDVTLTDGFDQAATLENGYEYELNLVVDSVSPSSGHTSGGDTVTLTGLGFKEPIEVYFGDTAAAVTQVNPTSVSVIVPAATSAGEVDLMVATDSQEVVLENSFTYTELPPQITSLSPDRGPAEGGQEVEISGNDFAWLGLSDVSSVGNHVVGLNSSGQVYTWGPGGSGRLGNGSVEDQLVPAGVDTSGVLKDKTITAISAGNTHTLALDSEGQVYAWGGNSSGQLGNGSTDNQLVPVVVDTSGALAGKTITAISAGNTHSLAVDSDGKVYAWGSNVNGRLGNGDSIDHTTPVVVDTSGILAGKTITAIAAGGAHSLALSSDGQVYAWGMNIAGQLGSGGASSVVPVSVDTSGALEGKTITAISAGTTHSLALDSDGQVYAWGSRATGRLGIGGSTSGSQTTPAAVDTSGVLAGKTITAISAGAAHSLALDSDGQVYAWGVRGSGRLGIGGSTSGSQITPAAVDTSGVLAGKTITAISAGSTHSVAIDTLGDVYAWGGGSGGSLGNGSTSGSETTPVLADSSYLTPPKVSFGGAEAKVISTEPSITSLVVETPAGSPGVVDVTVTNYDNQSFTLEDAYEFVAGPIITSASPSSAMKYGGDTITITGTGFNSGTRVRLSGQELVPTIISSTTLTFTLPAGVGGESVDIVVADEFGQVDTLQNAITYTEPAPQITSINPDRGPAEGGQEVIIEGSNFAAGLTRFTQVSAGFRHSLGLDSNGRVYAWGSGGNGVLGLGDTASRDMPTLVDGGAIAGKTIVAISAGSSHSLALDSDGKVYAWGSGDHGRLGIGSTDNQTIPVEVDTSGVLNGKVITAIAAGNQHSLALDSDGQVYSWGRNYYGELGTGSTSDQHTPVEVDTSGVLNGKVITAIATNSEGTGTSLALDSDGKVYAWGSGANGTLGNRSSSDERSPVAVDTTGALADKVVVAIAAGSHHSMALDSNGQVYTWGVGSRLGDGGGYTRNSPVAVDTTGALSGKTITAIASGGAHSLALDGDGRLYAWGLNGSGQLGIGSTDDQMYPALVSTSGALEGKTITVLDASAHSLVVDSKGNMYAWGNGGHGRLGIGNTDNQAVPVAVDQIFDSLPMVKFGESEPVQASNLTGGNSLIVQTPPHDIGLVDVTVTNYDGQSATLNDAYEFIAGPTATSVYPETGSTAGGDSVTIHGENFRSGANVTFGGEPVALTQFINENTIVVTTPAHVRGAVDVAVINPDGQTSTIEAGYTYIGPAPVVDSMTPAEGRLAGGNTVTFNGSGFDSGIEAYFGGVQAERVSINAGTLRFTVPAGQQLGDVDVELRGELTESFVIEDGYRYVPDAYAFTNEPLSLRETETGTLTLEVRNAGSDPITAPYDITLQLSSSSDSASFSVDGGETWGATEVVVPAGDSTVNVSYRDALKGEPTITATGPAGVQATQGAEVVTRYQLLVTGVSDPINQGVPSSVTVQAVDWNGNTMEDYTGTIRFSSTDNFAILPQEFTITQEMQGRYTFVNGVALYTPGEQCVIATDVSDSNITGSQCDITVGSGGISDKLPTQLQVITEEQNVNTHQASEAITIQAQDEDGMPAMVPTDYTIYATSSAGSDGQFSLNGVDGWSNANQPFELTIPEGATFVNVFYRDSQAGTKTLSFRDQVDSTDIGLTDTEQEILIGAGPPAGLTITAPENFPAQTWRPIKVSLIDDQGRPATNKDHPINLSFTASDPGVQLRLAPGDTAVTGEISASIRVGGNSVTIYAYSADPVTFEAVATDAADSLGEASEAITITSSNPVRIRTIPAQTTVGPDEPVEVSFQLEDSLGRPAALDNNRAIGLAGIGGSFSLSSDTWEPVTSVDLPAGSHSVSLFYRSSQAGERTIRGSISLSSGAQSHEAIITVLTGSYTRLGFSVGPSESPVHDGSRYVVTTYDLFGNAVSMAEDETLYLYTSGDGEFATSQDGPWGVAEVVVPAGGSSAEFWYRDSNLGAEPTLTVSDQSTLDDPDVGIINAEITVEIVGQTAARLSFTTSPQTITAGEVSDRIEVQTQKADGSPAIQGEDTVIALQVTPAAGGNGFVDSRSPGANSINSVIIPAGESTAEFYFHGERADEYVLAAQGANRTGEQALTIEPGAATKLAFASAPTHVVRNQPSSQIKIITADAYGNEVAIESDTTVQLGSNCDGVGSYSISANEWEPISQLVIPAGGSSAFVYFMTDAYECELTLQADNLESATQEVQAINGPHRLVFTSAVSEMELGETSQLTVSIVDEFGDVTEALAPIRVYFEAAGGSLGDDSVLINTGFSSTTVQFTAEELGSASVTARDQVGASDTGLIDATTIIGVVEGDPARLAISPATSNMTADTIKEFTVKLQNSYGRDVHAQGDIEVSLATDGDGRFLASGNPDASEVSSVVIPAGQSSAQVYYTQETSSDTTLTATGDELQPGTATVYVGAAQIDRYRIISQPESAELGQPTQVRVEALDAYGNVVVLRSGHSMYISTSGPEAAISSPNYDADTRLYTVASSTVTTSITVSVRALEIGDLTVTVSDTYPVDNPDQGIQNDSISYQVVHGDPYRLQFTSPAYTIERGGVAGPIRVALQNRYNMDIPALVDTEVELDAGSQTGQFALTTSGSWGIDRVVIPAGESTAMVYYRDNTALGERDLGAEHADLEVAEQVLTVVYGDPVEAKIISPPQTLYVSHVSQPIQVALVNQFGHPTAPADDTLIQIRSSSGDGQFMTNPNQPNWGVTSINWPRGREVVTFYYRDMGVGTPTISVLNTLMNDASQEFTVLPQVFDHFVVTNISDPQRMGTATSVVVMAKDAAGYTVVDYDGTIEFSSTDPRATLPGRYTFNPAIDKGIHTFTNGVIFGTPGEHVVTVRDVDTGQFGEQRDITVRGLPDEGTDPGPDPGGDPGPGPGDPDPETPGTDHPGDGGGGDDSQPDEGEHPGSDDSSDDTSGSDPDSPGVAPGSQDGSGSGSDTGRRSFGQSLVAGVASVGDFMTPLEVDFGKNPIASAVATVFYSAQVFLVVALLREAYKEVAKVYHIRRSLAKQRQLATDKQTFLRLAGHYLRTPIAILEAAVSTELAFNQASGQVAQGGRVGMLAQIQDAVARLRSRSEFLLEEGAAKTLEPITDPNIEKATRSALKSPFFWLPLVLSVVLTLAANWLLAATAAGQMINSSGLVYAGVISVALVLIVVFSLRTVHINRERQQLNQSLEHYRELLFATKNKLIHEAEQALSSDIATLQGLTTHPQLISNESLAGPVKDSLGKLTDLNTKLQLLTQINGVSLQTDNITADELVDHAIYRHTNKVVGKQLKLKRRISGKFKIRQDARLLRYVISTVMDNAVKFSQVGGKIGIGAKKDGGDLVVEVKNEGGFGSEEAARQVFEPFNHATNQEDLTADGMGLSMYLNKLIVDQLGGEIKAINAEGGKTAVVELRVPAKL